MRIIIVGLNSAGIGAALSARKINYDAEIVVYEMEKYTAYSRCGLPFVIGKEIESFDKLIDFPDEFYEKMDIEINLETEVLEIDTKNKEIKVKGKKGISTDKYDKLILATGGVPRLPPLKGIDKKNVYTLRSIEDAKKIVEAAKKSKNAIIIGAGLIGLEAADALNKLGLKVTLIELLPQVLQTLLDSDMTKKILKEMDKRGIKIILNCSNCQLKGEEEVESAIALDQEIPADLVLVTTAVKPRIDLAKKAGINIGETGGIKVNMRLETNIPDIYACGDGIEYPDFITRRPILCQVGTVANSMGKVAGVNAAGGYAVMDPVLIVAIIKVFGLEIGHVGFTEAQVKERGMLPIVALVSGKTKSPYFPGAKDIDVKLIFGLASSHLIGAQLIGEDGVAVRANFLSAAITNRMTAYDLAKLNVGYTPPLNSPVEPIVQAAEAADNMIKHCRASFDLK